MQQSINRIRLEFKANEVPEKASDFSSINRIRLEFKVCIVAFNALHHYQY